jgi:thiamine biosynthesis lipoprotein
MFMPKKVLLFFFILILIVSTGFIHLISSNPDKSLHTLTGQAQGTTYSIKYIHTSSIIEKSPIQKIFSEIEKSLSLYQPTSLISHFNKAVRGVKSDVHLSTVVRNSLMVSTATNGCFDITIKPISMIWGFNASTPKSIPSNTLLQKTKKFVGHHHLIFNNDSLLKDNPNTQIDCDGIAQGYTVDQLASYILSKGITDFMVEVGGEVFTSGKNLAGKDWIIGIEGLEVYKGDDHFITKKISLSNKAVTTSGSMKKYRKLGNKYWSHIIDPRTSMPVDNGIVAVTVIAPDAITADAYDNAFMVMGLNKAFALANSIKDMGLYIVYANKDGSVSDSSNACFKQFIIQQ